MATEPTPQDQPNPLARFFQAAADLFTPPQAQTQQPPPQDTPAAPAAEAAAPAAEPPVEPPVEPPAPQPRDDQGRFIPAPEVTAQEPPARNQQAPGITAPPEQIAAFAQQAAPQRTPLPAGAFATADANPMASVNITNFHEYPHAVQEKFLAEGGFERALGNGEVIGLN